MPLKRPRNAEPTRARMDAFARGEIWGLHSAGVPREEIRARVVKQDGTAPSEYIYAILHVPHMFLTCSSHVPHMFLCYLQHVPLSLILRVRHIPSLTSGTRR